SAYVKFTPYFFLNSALATCTSALNAVLFTGLSVRFSSFSCSVSFSATAHTFSLFCCGHYRRLIKIFQVPLRASGHFLLLHLVVYDVPSRQLAAHVVGRDAHVRHQHQRVIGKVRQLIHSLGPVVGLAGDDDLRALLAHLLE